jgi:hypothetical protein
VGASSFSHHFLLSEVEVGGQQHGTRHAAGKIEGDFSLLMIQGVDLERQHGAHEGHELKFIRNAICKGASCSCSRLVYAFFFHGVISIQHGLTPLGWLLIAYPGLLLTSRLSVCAVRNDSFVASDVHQNGVDGSGYAAHNGA